MLYFVIPWLSIMFSRLVISDNNMTNSWQVNNNGKGRKEKVSVCFLTHWRDCLSGKSFQKYVADLVVKIVDDCDKFGWKCKGHKICVNRLQILRRLTPSSTIFCPYWELATKSANYFCKAPYRQHRWGNWFISTNRRKTHNLCFESSDQ